MRLSGRRLSTPTLTSLLDLSPLAGRVDQDHEEPDLKRPQCAEHLSTDLHRGGVGSHHLGVEGDLREPPELKPREGEEVVVGRGGLLGERMGVGGGPIGCLPGGATGPEGHLG